MKNTNWWQEVYDREYSVKKRNFNADQIRDFKHGRYIECYTTERSWAAVLRTIRNNAKAI